MLESVELEIGEKKENFHHVCAVLCFVCVCSLGKCSGFLRRQRSAVNLSIDRYGLVLVEDQQNDTTDTSGQDRQVLQNKKTKLETHVMV
jgi:hypothetical protein